MKPIILIPARMASSRLPNKPLADICGVPMIVRVWQQAMAAQLGPVVVAADCLEIADTVRAAGGTAVLTDPNLPSGSDRVFAALKAVDPTGNFDTVVNLQGDLPAVDPRYLQGACNALIATNAHIATLVAEIEENDPQADNPNATKAVVAWDRGTNFGRAMYFTRARAPWGPGPVWFHVGLYVYTRQALTRFIAMQPSPLEKRERLEQLRALEAGMHIAVTQVPSIPLSIDTQEDLDAARKLIAAGKSA